MISWTQPGIGSHEKQELDEMIGTLVVLSENVFRFGEQSCEDPPYQLRVTNFGRTLKRCKSNPTSGCKFVWQQAEFVSSCLGQEVPDIEVEFAVDCAAFDYLPTCRFLSSERMLLKMEGSYLCFERVDHTE